MEREPNHPEKQRAKWEELAKGPSTAETPGKLGKERTSSQTTEQNKKTAPPEWVRSVLDSFQQQKAEAPGLAKEKAKDIATLNQQFIKRNKQIREGNHFMSKKEFLNWEDDYATEWKFLQEYLQDGNLTTTEKEAEVETPMLFTLDKDVIGETIEVQAGEYYRERSRALRDAIRASDNPKKEADLKTVDDFFTSVYRHVELRYMTIDEQRSKYGSEGGRYDAARTSAHNNVIDHLNQLNDLARKYSTTPFTPRKFWKSIGTNQTESVARRMKYDRGVVEEYYTLAFSKELEDLGPK